jgi:hypothetical protein
VSSNGLKKPLQANYTFSGTTYGGESVSMKIQNKRIYANAFQTNTFKVSDRTRFSSCSDDIWIPNIDKQIVTW